MLNLTACASPPNAGASWTLTADGHVSNANSTDCLTLYSCDNTPGSTVFAYSCVTDACKCVLPGWLAVNTSVRVFKLWSLSCGRAWATASVTGNYYHIDPCASLR